MKTTAAFATVLFLAVLGAPAAHAQSLADGPRKVDRKTARAAGDALIAASSLPKAFKVDVWATGPMIVHRASGLTCPFLADAPGNAVKVYDPGEGDGMDVGCLMPTPAFNQSLFASHIRQAVSLDNAFERALASLKTRLPNLTPMPDTASVSPDVRMARFTTGAGPNAVYERLAVARKGDWVITQRFSAPASIIAAADRVADISLFANLRPTSR
jgi:hypothetical protein